ncbi:MAG: hypothetical protein WBL93_10780 [Lutisporaceae bacterium]
MFNRKSQCRIITIIVCTLLILVGCSKIDGTLPPDEKNGTPVQGKESQEKKFWLIKIDQKNNEPFMGSLGDNSIPAENTMHFIAMNDSESPYEGVFRGYADIESFTDLKEALGVDNTEYLNISAKHTAETFTFNLTPTELASLTKDEKANPLLVEASKADFLMPTKGDNPASVFGSVQGYKFSENKKLDYSLTCTLTQLNGIIELKTDMFGLFTGTIVRMNEDELEFEPAPLTPSVSPEELFNKVKESFQKEYSDTND